MGERRQTGASTEGQQRTPYLPLPVGFVHSSDSHSAMEEKVASRDDSSSVLVRDAIELFQLSRRSNCTPTTMAIREANLGRFARCIGSYTPLGDVSTLAIEQYLVGLLQTMKPISMDQHDRDLRAFFRWAQETGLVASNPMRGIPRPRIPLPLPDIPTEDELRAVLASCPASFEGARNRAMILTMADAALRAGELVHARVRDWDLAEHSIVVRLGKGRKDRKTFVSPVTADAIRHHLVMRRPGVVEADPLFADAQGRSLTRRHLVQILHRLSARAGLPHDRRLHPHALRHLAATLWLRNGMGLDHVRRLMGHTSIAMTLRYSSLVAADLQRAHQEAAAIERLGVLSNVNRTARARPYDSRARKESPLPANFAAVWREP